MVRPVIAFLLAKAEAAEVEASDALVVAAAAEAALSAASVVIWLTEDAAATADASAASSDAFALATLLWMALMFRGATGSSSGEFDGGTASTFGLSGVTPVPL